MSELRVGVIGLGVISRFYVEAFAGVPGIRLEAVCDLRPEVLDPFAGRARRYIDHRAMLAAGGIDAVVVNAPNDVHLEICRDVLNAGLPVCVEKPLALDVAGGRELSDLARARGLTLFTAFHRRYNDNVLRLRDGLPAGVPIAGLTVRYLEKIEEHAGTDSWYLDPGRCGGGCVADNGPNAYDLVRLFLGEVSVEDVRVTRDGAGVDQQAVVELRSTGGVPARVELDWAYPGEIKDVTVRLADGTTAYADMLAGHSEFKSSLWHEYVAVLTDFAAAVRGGPSSHRAEDGLAALRLVERTYAREAR
ncbi:putative dehydrogenase [Actinoplanes campanulatus]|uniref:Putative dehydrogenase n=1 Tax=Actinoplanes campanulatus TaxID=113559 RepID=A0A7W5FH08_9ACTN|nr:Gfo/Idh/MocA family oxidoreductase [Actinoplanes campanulatus]MBB3098168.1 putative dehydrogenase [Actinoplanes campanulatus]GGN32736.1 dehydrogenase [Actinoplanes campanulatus]GID39958.1 dehydrogenase [Actinoplanes campanulatus]